MFNISDIDNFLSFSDKKNICIVNRSHKNNNFLYSIFAQFCIDYWFNDTINKEKKNKRTLLIDGGNGNNLGYIYLNLTNRSINLTNRSIKDGFDIHKILDNIIIVRAFTFYQLANIIIKEIPKLMDKFDCKIQIVVMDLLGTLLPSSSTLNNKIKKYSNYNLKKDLDENINLLNEIIDNLIHISDKYFVIVSYNDFNDLAEKALTSKFKNAVETKEQDNITKDREQDKGKTKLQIKLNQLIILLLEKSYIFRQNI